VRDRERERERKARACVCVVAARAKDVPPSTQRQVFVHSRTAVTAVAIPHCEKPLSSIFHYNLYTVSSAVVAHDLIILS